MQSLLQADGMTAALFDDVPIGIVPWRISPLIRSMVASTQLDRAGEILKEYLATRNTEHFLQEACVCGSSASPTRTIPFWSVLVLFVLGIFPGVIALYWHKRLICPDCRRARGRA